MNKVI